MNKKILDLNGDWSLWIAPHSEVKKSGFAASDASTLVSSGFCNIPAEVPGNFELDMHREGLLPDPYFGTNTLLCQKEENKHLWYSRTFEIDSLPEDDTYLRFDGIDTFAEIFLNGKQIGYCDNMLIEHEYAADGLKVGTNEIVVHIIPTLIKIREFESAAINKAAAYGEDAIHVRKAASMFGWDIMPRIVSGGIWKSVSLVTKPQNSIEEFYIATKDIKGKNAQVICSARVLSNEDYMNDLTLVVTGKCGESEFKYEKMLWSANNFFNFTISDPLLWWPRNTGEQNLYDVKAELLLRGELCDTYTCKFGIRTIKLDRTSVVERLPDGTTDGKFEFIVNGKKVFIMGTNWVPLDAFHSNDINRLDRAFDMVNDLGCNMIRCWGGNVYENDEFYDLCDKNGVLIWQDFGMACAIYPQNDDFCQKLREEAIAVIKRLRSHASLALWSGDNECDCSYAWGFGKGNVDPNSNILTRQVLKKTVLEYDPFRPYLPSSPYIDEIAFKSGKPTAEAHLWGPRDYFKSDYYINAVARFASEMGYHGCNSTDSLRNFIGEDHLWPSVKENGRADEEWAVHAACMEIDRMSGYEYRISLMNRQVIELFNDPKVSEKLINDIKSLSTEQQRSIMRAKVLEMFGDSLEGLENFAKASQIFQAEGFKFVIENFRINKTTHGGVIWWNLIDGWPQLSDAIVDYYYIKKLAYGFILNSQQPLCMMFDEPKNGYIDLYAANEYLEAHSLTYKVTRVSDGKVVLDGKCNVDESGILRVGSVKIGADEREWYLIEWQDENGNVGRNHFVTNIRGISYNKYMEALTKTDIARFEGFSK